MINVGIYGYGNLGKGVECAIHQNEDFSLVGIFTRRNPESVKTLFNTPVYSASDVLSFKDKIDVLIICGGSATDLPEQTPMLSQHFNVVDSFDTHAKIPEHFSRVNEVCIENNKTSLISSGWDPGLFSLNRVYASSVLADSKFYTFWGKGVSQGHSDAIRRINGVKDAKQYTIPVDSSLELVRSGVAPELSTRQKHTRECFVVVEDGADKGRIESEIKSMPNYFADYDTTVHFISQAELDKNHAGIPHGGFVICTGKTGVNGNNNHVIEYSLKLDSNPEFTASVLVCYARAVYKMTKKGDFGCKTVFDVPPAYLSKLSNEELRKTLL